MATKREKMIGLGVGAAVLLYVLDQTVVEPYFNQIHQLTADTTVAMSKQGDNKQLFIKQIRMTREWAEMKNNGLSDDISAAETQAQHAVLNWTHWAGITLTRTAQPKTVKQGQFQVSSFNLSGTGTTWAVAKMLWAFESAKVPVRVVEMNVTPQKENTDDLKFDMVVSTLCQLPETPKPAVASGGQP